MLLQSRAPAPIVDYFCNCDYLEILKFASEQNFAEMEFESRSGTIKIVTL